MLSQSILENKSKNNKKNSHFKQKFKEWFEVLPFIGLGLVLLSVFVVYPQIKNIYMAFTNYNIMPGQPSEFVGFANFMRAFHSEKFWLAFRNTVLYGVVTVPGQMAIGLIVAVLINNVIKGKNLYKVMIYIPVITSWIVVSLIFKYLFTDGKEGLINYALLKLHLISDPISWLQNTWTANFVIWVLGIWKGIGWVMVIYLAALQGIPNELYEAAEVDGANPVQTFFKIIIPLIKPTTFFILINLIIGAFGVFIQVMMITNGAPLGTTDVLLNYMYNRAFSDFEFGYASAISVIIGIVIMAITLLLKRLLKYDEFNY
ncbi:carbohydrate ABC transporter membrane protein 1, CUT1 family [Thermoanaerobacter thermohydrosulfuricus]|jgi:multiple sugar transport system permease protein|uniref:Carbohydrate ABC transporter membrane protein 1, CUT1 family n=1 Tax=Thermoanaerobacter thermohydrosulfuricus TaxID=1516 RepID=A0A1I1Z7Z2_THETY|nr:MULTISPECIES: sugar ABC transporter permease [Thermoanaerobacter]MBT1279037.1 sugar ABC transporter permease [Thermoanaerobacter sp. CM-CNRG TB177]UZQ82688.1 sugar ABC transporter permease [Thermoanaerobacter sp. RKWS2]SDF54689.1 carbohydrate ABC transporter membrane protein 1, CUT1 family [Thermoanaerobacter thermohydrosulfuricus]SFE27974.1 carbohydrate ABC transporter membrane protein 1, CUT1 family [Thermoanaerobacter thermohydrosulfuricus]